VVRKLLANMQGITCFGISIVMFWFAGPIIQRCDPSAGTWDRGSIHGLVIGAAAYFLAIWLAWMAFQLEWPSLDRHIDDNRWMQDWRAMSPAARVWHTLIVWSILFLGALMCLLSWK